MIAAARATYQVRFMDHDFHAIKSNQVMIDGAKGYLPVNFKKDVALIV
jgi:hypothetical protein